jgi:hypothetical protein
MCRRRWRLSNARQAVGIPFLLNPGSALCPLAERPQWLDRRRYRDARRYQQLTEQQRTNPGPSRIENHQRPPSDGLRSSI